MGTITFNRPLTLQTPTCGCALRHEAVRDGEKTIDVTASLLGPATWGFCPLHAAAPDLAAACEAVLRWFAGEAGTSAEMDAQARAALQKAGLR